MEFKVGDFVELINDYSCIASAGTRGYVVRVEGKILYINECSSGFYSWRARLVEDEYASSDEEL